MADLSKGLTSAFLTSRTCVHLCCIIDICYKYLYIDNFKLKSIIMSDRVNTMDREGGPGTAQAHLNRVETDDDTIRWVVSRSVCQTHHLVNYSLVPPPLPSMISRAWRKAREKTSSCLTLHRKPRCPSSPSLFSPHRRPMSLLRNPRYTRRKRIHAIRPQERVTVRLDLREAHHRICRTVRDGTATRLTL
jgi:hypothetical protein